jgi:hypothetical protein
LEIQMPVQTFECIHDSLSRLNPQKRSTVRKNAPSKSAAEAHPGRPASVSETVPWHRPAEPVCDRLFMEFGKKSLRLADRA